MALKIDDNGTISTSTEASKSGVERLVNPLDLIAHERRRQKEVEGWTTKHDDEHKDGSMAMAAACYAAHSACDCNLHDAPKPSGVTQRIYDAQALVRRMWPWDKKWWKPKSRIRNLVRAGALIVAEIERLQRKEG